MTAYLLLAVVLWHVIDAMRAQAPAVVARGAWLLLAAVLLQAVLGILTLLNQVPIDLALSHQAVAIVVLTIAVVNLERLSPRRVTALSEKLSPAVG
jgi:cytochrome c oxidase assembly protein subunit 15